MIRKELKLMPGPTSSSSVNLLRRMLVEEEAVSSDFFGVCVFVLAFFSGSAAKVLISLLSSSML